MFSVYAIRNKKHDKIYVGQTKDLPSRLAMHNKHTFKSYTSRFDGKWELVYSEKVATRTEALKREKQLKSYRGRQFVKGLIEN